MPLLNWCLVGIHSWVLVDLGWECDYVQRCRRCGMGMAIFSRERLGLNIPSLIWTC